MKIIHSQDLPKSKFDPEKDYCEGCENEIPESEMDEAHIDENCIFTCKKCYDQLKKEAKEAGKTIAEYTNYFDENDETV